MYLKETQSVITWEEGGSVLPVTVEQISLEQGPALLLTGPIVLGLLFVISTARLVSTFQSRPDWMLPVAVVPGGAVRFPGSQTDPAEVCLASLVLADHVVAATVLLYGGVTLQRIIQ